MNTDSRVSTAALEFSSKNATEFITTIPARTGLYRIANVPPEEFDRDWVSRSGGRFCESGADSRYYTIDKTPSLLETRHELGVEPTGITYSIESLCNSIDVFDVHKLPQDIQEALYEDRDSSAKYEKSLLLMDAIEQSSKFVSAQLKGVLYQSASGNLHGIEGNCLLLTDSSVQTKIIDTGDCSGLKDWKGTIYP